MYHSGCKGESWDALHGPLRGGREKNRRQRGMSSSVGDNDDDDDDGDNRW